MNRDLYRSVIKITTIEGSKLRDVPEDQILDEIRGFVGSTQDSSLTSDELKQEQVRQDEIIIVKRKIDMGMGYKNPVKKVKYSIPEMRPFTYGAYETDKFSKKVKVFNKKLIKIVVFLIQSAILALINALG